ncbi:hypothetical protein CLAIMM_02863 [Cladophialophora immunda]|nr:hypothetical protein CLAIMM_02863 [Cladophialophora immunda]
MERPSARAPRTQPRIIGRSDSCLDFVKEGVLVPLPAAAPNTDDVPITGDDSVREDVVEDGPREEVVKDLVSGVLEDVTPTATDAEVVKAKEGDEAEEIDVEVNGADEVEGVPETPGPSLDVESYEVGVYGTLEVVEAPSGEEFPVAGIADPAAADTAEAAEDRSELTSV